jgi:hypothetical protein
VVADQVFAQQALTVDLDGADYSAGLVTAVSSAR